MANEARVSPIARLLKPGWKNVEVNKNISLWEGGDKAEHKKQIWTLYERHLSKYGLARVLNGESLIDSTRN